LKNKQLTNSKKLNFFTNLTMGPDDPFTIEEFCIILGLAIVAIIVFAINRFLEDDNRQNQSEERTVGVHAKSCKGTGANVEAFNDQGSSSLNAQTLSLMNASLKNRKSTVLELAGLEKAIIELASLNRRPTKILAEQIKEIFDKHINVQDESGKTTLHRNAGLGHLDVVKYHLENVKSMDLHIQDNDGNTPLHAACKNGNIDVAKALLTAGANQNIENKEKKKPFQVAKPEVIEALRKLLSNRRGGWNNKRGKFKNQG